MLLMGAVALLDFVLYSLWMTCSVWLWQFPPTLSVSCESVLTALCFHLPFSYLIVFKFIVESTSMRLSRRWAVPRLLSKRWCTTPGKRPGMHSNSFCVTRYVLNLCVTSAYHGLLVFDFPGSRTAFVLCCIADHWIKVPEEIHFSLRYRHCQAVTLLHPSSPSCPCPCLCAHRLFHLPLPGSKH